jgi:glycosyltransferase involved in cell wall biosynthesis
LSGWLQACPIVLAPYLRRVGVSGGGGDAARWMSPLKIFESMAHGRALIASDLPVLREVVEDGVTGLLCAPEDLAGWQAAVQRLIDAPEVAHAIGRRAREVVARRHTWLGRAQVVVS